MPKRTRSRSNPKRKKTRTNRPDWDEVFRLLRDEAAQRASPSLNVLTDSGSSPWQILVATILSLRTRDEVTVTTSRRLFALAPDPAATRQMSTDAIAAAIYPAGFYLTKARQIQEIAQALESRGDSVPATREELRTFPGVGPKTANLVLNLAFWVDAICVDTHVHRIPNRLGWIATKTPEESEVALELLWPRKYWIEANALLVSFGQNTCKPLSPRCSQCGFEATCPRIGVGKSR